MEKAVLVYQAGIANVFAVECFNLANFGRDAFRLMQADFRTCESFAMGLKVAGVTVMSFHCNQAGDIRESLWSDWLLDAPFNDKFHPVYSEKVAIPDEIREYYRIYRRAK